MKTENHESAGFGVKDGKGRDVKLAMQDLWLTGQVLPVGARLVVRHVFRSAEKKPVEVVYAFALPRDAALRQFRIEGDGFTVESDLRPTGEAQELYEKGIEDGHLSALAKQYGDGLVNLAVGNLKPDEQVTVYLELISGTEVHDDGFRFRFPFTLAPTYHPKQRMIEVAPGVGEQELPEDEFGDLLLPPFHKDARDLHRVGFDLSIPSPMGSTTVASPSHALKVGPQGDDGIRISLATEADMPNRDLVLDVSTGRTGVTVISSPDTSGRGQFAAIIPSTIFGKRHVAARRVVFVLDRSGSMGGRTIEQAKRAVQACLATLSPEDSFGIVAFDDQSDALHQTLLKGDAENRRKAAAFLDQVDARGGTELSRAIVQAAKLLGGDEGDLFVVTDGQVSATERILGKAKALGVRIHVLGIGSASQDRFLTLLARETGGISRYVTGKERVDTAAVDLFASAGSPLAKALSVSGKGFKNLTIEPALPKNVLAGSPVVLFGTTEGAGNGSISLSWRGPVAGSSEIGLAIPRKPTCMAETLLLLRGARLITDADACSVNPDDSSAAARREARRSEKRLQDLSRKYGLASRFMSLVAVVKREGDVGGQVPQTQVVPVGMPEDTPFGAYFSQASCAMSPPPATPLSGDISAIRYFRRAAPAMSGTVQKFTAAREAPAPSVESMDTDDLLMALATRLEPDGGMPGRSDADRFARSLVALQFFAQNGNTPNGGAFRTHVQKLIEYLERSTLLHVLHEIRSTAHSLGNRLAHIGQFAELFPGATPLGEMARAHAQCRRSMGDLLGGVDEQIGMLEDLLRRIRRGETTPDDQASIVREMIKRELSPR